MTVYVEYASAARPCRMTADTHDELVAMAYRVGLDPRAIRAGRIDISLTKRTLAVQHGAMEISAIDMARMRHG